MWLKHFTRGATATGLAMLNAIVDKVNFLYAWLGNFRGDEQFIYVDRSMGGGIVRLDINAVLRRVPKPLTISAITALKITGTVTMGGVYTVQTLAPVSGDMNHTDSTYDFTTLGSTMSGTHYLYNLPEMGQTTHDLAYTGNTATVVLGLAWTVNSDNTINYIGVGVFPGCS